jgi:hypothetical protein
VKHLEVNELIKHIKKELSTPPDDDDIFFVEEIQLEINFTVTGTVDGGFNLGVVTVDSNVNEERIQKVTLKLMPIVSKEELLKKMPEDQRKSIVDQSARTLFKGSKS